ncbi:MAG: hypothetical protein U0S49_14120 [Rhodospirillales bacterium]|nr:hypothetical protein [Rhodospirillales bacterium]
MASDRVQPTILIYGIDGARAAAAAAASLGLAVTLLVPAPVAAGLGADVIGKLFAIVRDEVPQARITAAVDCADAPGLALALLRRGIDALRVEGPEDMLRRIAEIASQCGASLAEEPAESLDLLAVRDPRAACEAWLGGFKTEATRPNCE